MRSLLLVVLIGGSQAAHGAGDSYMSLVGQLYAGVELPRMMLAECTAAYPQLSTSLSRQYQSWHDRNSAFLASAATQFSRADSRLKAQGHALAELDEPFARRIRDTYDLNAVCHAYDKVLISKEHDLQGELKRLLDIVTYADGELSKRG